nr:movement protein [Capsicum mild mottle virus]
MTLRDSVKIDEFINLSKSEEILPAAFTRMKSVRISTVDKLIAKENDYISEVDLLKGVKLVKNGYVCLVGLVVSGEWNLPDNCKGGVSICLVDKRMQRSHEATLGSYTAKASKKNFSFKLIPNYSVTTQDAERRPWEVMVNIKGVAMEEGWCPLSLEFVSVCVVHKTNVRKGLREKVTSVSEGETVELSEAVVEEFIENVPMARRLQNLRKKNIGRKYSDAKNAVNSVKGKPGLNNNNNVIKNKVGSKNVRLTDLSHEDSSTEMSSDSF